MSDIYVSDRAQLLSALSSAKGGDTITLRNGSYGGIELKQDFSSMVTVRAENPLGAKLAGITLNGASNLRFDGVHVDSPSNGGQGGAVVLMWNGTHDIQIVNSKINGKVDGVYDGHYAVFLRGANNVLLQNNDIHDARNGVVAFGAANLQIVGNEIDRTADDAMKLSGVSKGLIENNVGGGKLYPIPGGHMDFIQFQGSDSRDLVIRGNVYLAETRSDVQGIFLDDAAFRNVLIEDNIIYTGMMRGISVSAGSGVTIRDNTLLNVPGEIHNGTKIFAPGGSVVSNNIISGHTGGAWGSNFIVQNGDASKPYYVDKYFLRGSEGRGVSLDDLRPVPGSLAESMGAVDRLKALLGGGGEAPVPNPIAGGAPQPAPAPAPATPADGSGDLVFARPGNTELSGGASGIVRVPHSDALEIAEGSIAFGFDADKVSGVQGLVSKDATGYSGGGNHFAAWIENGELRLRFQDEDSSAHMRAGGIRAGQKNEVLVTFEADEIRLYLNDRLVAEQDFTMDWQDNSQNLVLGGLNWSGGSGSTSATDPFDGTMSDVAILDAALTPAELDQLLV